MIPVQMQMGCPCIDRCGKLHFMMKRMTLFLLFFWNLSACRPAPPPELPPQEWVRSAATSMAELQGFHFLIDRSGAPAFIDSGQTLSFRRAEGEYAAPDRAQAEVRLILPGFVTNMKVVSVGAVQWETNPLTGRWSELPADWGFNPAVLFQEDVGLPAILADDLSEMSVAGPEKLENGRDVLLYRVTGVAAGERLYELTGTLIGPDPVQVTMWIEPETFFIHRIVAVEAAPDNEEPSVWQVDFSQFDTAFVIEPPVLP